MTQADRAPRRRRRPRAGATLDLDAAAELTRTGDLWLFRGRSGADRAIQSLTNAPVNHVGMAVVLDDLPPCSGTPSWAARCRTPGPGAAIGASSCTTYATRCSSGDAGTASEVGCASSPDRPNPR
jgi:hypothetical protein